MCLYIPNSNKVKIKEAIGFVQISTKDIYVYKKFIPQKVYDNKKGHTLLVFTPYMDFEVSKDGDIMTTNKFGFKKEYYITVHQGIHAYIDKPNGALGAVNLIRCLIPAGTPYIIAGIEIVTLQLIIPPMKLIANGSLVESTL